MTKKGERTKAANKSSRRQLPNSVTDSFLDLVVCRHFMLLKKRYASGFSARKGGRCRSSIVFRFLGESLSLHYPEDFFLCLLVGHPFPYKGKHQLIHERIQFGEFPCVHP